jgi:phage minor structural protein
MFNIYDKKTTKGSFNNNGLGILNECIRFEVTEEKNGDYSLELDYPSNSKKAAFFEKYNIIKDDKGQLFRIYQVQKDSKDSSVTTVWAKHIFYDLSFDLIENVTFSNLSMKSAMTMALTTTMASIFTVDSDIVVASSLSFSQINCAQAIFNILEKWGMGELVRDNFSIKILTAMGKDNGVTVKYGKNINEIKVINDSTDIVTKLYPVGNNGIALTEKYVSVVDWNGIQYPPFPIVKKVTFDADDEVTLRAMAMDVATTIGLERTTIEIDLIELSKTKEYANYSKLEAVNVGDIVTVQHSDLNINGKVQVVKIVSDRLTGINSKVYLGQLRKTSEDINKLLKTTTDQMGNMVAQATSSMLYYANPGDLNISTTSQQPVYLGVTAVANTNLSLFISIYGNASQVCTITLNIQIDGSNISFKPKQKLQQGDNIIGIPLGIPQVSAGAHYLGITVSVDSGAFTVPMYNFQCMIDGRNLQGGLNAEPPHAEVKQMLTYIDMVTVHTVLANTVIFSPQAGASVLQQIGYSDPCLHISSTNSNVALVRVADQTDFNSSDMSSYTQSSFIIMDGTLHFVFSYSTVMTSSTLGSGTLFTGVLPDASNFAGIEGLVVS